MARATILKTLLVVCPFLAACGSSLMVGPGPGGLDGSDKSDLLAPDLSASVDGGSPADSGDGGADAGGCGHGNVMNECMTNADCDDGDPSTVDTCQLGGGEFPVGTCLHSGCDGGVNCALQAVDPNCANTDAGVAFPPYVPLHPPDVPANCTAGFELADATANGGVKYAIMASAPAGSRAIIADLDFATYLAPDGLQITGVDGNCKKYTLFDSCHLQTATEAESTYTNGKARPSDIAIRQYHLAIRQGTSQLTFDFSRVVSPMYVEVFGLCDFTLTQLPANEAGWFQLLP